MGRGEAFVLFKDILIEAIILKNTMFCGLTLDKSPFYSDVLTGIYGYTRCYLSHLILRRGGKVWEILTTNEKLGVQLQDCGRGR